VNACDPQYTGDGYDDSIPDHVATHHGYQICHPKVRDSREESLGELV